MPFFRLLFLFLTYIRIFFDISKNVYYRNIKMILIVTSIQPDLFRNYTYIIIWHDKNIANISDLLLKLKIRCNFSSARNLRHLLKTLLDLIAHLSSHKTHYRPYCFCRIRCTLYTYTYWMYRSENLNLPFSLKCSIYKTITNKWANFQEFPGKWSSQKRKL